MSARSTADGATGGLAPAGPAGAAAAGTAPGALGDPAAPVRGEGAGAASPAVDVSAVIALMDDCPELEEIITQYAAEFRDRGARYEFVLVLDGLGEARTELVRRRVPSGEPVRLVVFNQPFGPERALATGYREARGAIVVSLPSYLQLDPGDIHKVIDALSGDYDLVAGWRVPRVDPWTNRLQSWVYNRLMSSFTGVDLHDLNCGLTGMRRHLIGEVLVEGNVSRFLPVLAHRQGFRVGEVRVRHLREKGRAGFFGLGVYVRRVLDVIALLFITRFTRKPLRFFGVAGGLCVLLGLAICGYLWLDHMLGLSVVGDPRNRASLVIGVALIVMGVNIFSIGLVGEIIIFTNSRHVRDYTLERELGPGLAPQAPRALGAERPRREPDDAAVSAAASRAAGPAGGPGRDAQPPRGPDLGATSRAEPGAGPGAGTGTGGGA